MVPGSKLSEWDFGTGSRVLQVWRDSVIDVTWDGSVPRVPYPCVSRTLNFG